MALNPVDAYLSVDFTSFVNRQPLAKVEDEVDYLINLIGEMELRSSADDDIAFQEFSVKWRTSNADNAIYPEPNGPTPGSQEMKNNSILIKGTTDSGKKFTIADTDQHSIKMNGTARTVAQATTDLRAQLDPAKLVVGIDETNAQDVGGQVLISPHHNTALYKIYRDNLKAQTGR